MGPSLSVVVFPARIAHTSRFDPGVGNLTIFAYSRDPLWWDCWASSNIRVKDTAVSQRVSTSKGMKAVP